MTPSRKMIRLALAGVLLAWSAILAPAQTTPKASARLPPLIDRELFFGDPDLTDAQISPDGRFIAFLKPWKGTRNVWVKKSEDPYLAARLMTAEPHRPIRRYFWSRDSRYILFVQDRRRHDRIPLQLRSECVRKDRTYREEATSCSKQTVACAH